ncbi:MAG: MFS transporter [Acidobacteriales bacterium]|nr:MFS transporter [Terriglobales bacterium]
MARFFERLLNLRRGDLQRGLLLFLYLFLIISSYQLGKVARDALFLDRFAAVKLPYAIIVIAVLVGFVVAAYVRIGERVGLRRLLVGSLLIFAVTFTGFWVVARFYRFDALFPILYVWVGIFGVLAPAQVWTLSNYVLTTREAKRVFGLIGGGAIAGWMFAGYFAQATAKLIGAESLLLSVAVLLTVSAILVYIIYSRHRPEVAEEHEKPEIAAKEEHLGIRASLELVGSSPYLRAIAILICVNSFVTTFAGWQFSAIAQQFVSGKDALAEFFGTFNFWAALASLGVQLLLTSRLLRQFGIGPALFILPVSLAVGEFGVILGGSLLAGVMLKGGDQVLRYSIDKSTTELLYLPVSPSIKLQVKSFIDTVIWRMGDGFAALTLLLFATYLTWSPRQVGWVNLTMIALWAGVAWVARKQYVVTLRDSVRQHRLDAEKTMAPVIDRSTAQVLADNICVVDPKEILYTLSLFETEQQPAAHPVIRDLLGHPDARVRQKAISLLSAAKDLTVSGRIENALKDPDLGVRTQALLYLAHHMHVDPLVKIEQLGDFPDFSIRAAMVSFLAGPADWQSVEAAGRILDGMVNEGGEEGQPARLEAARLIPLLPYTFEKQLRQLMRDEDVEVARAAIQAAAQAQKRSFVPLLVELLGTPELTADAALALSNYGDRVVGTLRDYLTDPAAPVEVRREVPYVLTDIGTYASARALSENLLEADTTVRFRIIVALNKLQKAHPSAQPDMRMVETLLAAEIMGHYRSYQIVGTLTGTLEETGPVSTGLRESMAQEEERIFRLLGLLYPRQDLHSAYFGLKSRDALVHDNALEFLDNILNKNLRDMLVPLIDSDVSVAERVRIANRMTGTKIESREEAIGALIGSEDPWLKSCAAYAIGVLQLQNLQPALEDCLQHPDPLLRETARQAKRRLSGVEQVAAAVA